MTARVDGGRVLDKSDENYGSATNEWLQKVDVAAIQEGGAEKSTIGAVEGTVSIVGDLRERSADGYMSTDGSRQFTRQVTRGVFRELYGVVSQQPRIGGDPLVDLREVLTLGFIE